MVHEKLNFPPESGNVDTYANDGWVCVDTNPGASIPTCYTELVRPSEQETCDCGIRQTMQHLLVCPMMDSACSSQDLAMANGIAIGCAKHWEGTI